jgi:hypothetical protein
VKTYQCRHQDGGICGFPEAAQDHALLLWDRTLSIVSWPLLREVTRQGLLPSAFIEPTSNVRALKIQAEEVVDVVQSLIRADSDQDDPIDIMAERIDAEAGTKRGVIVTCSCGHTWIIDV